MNGILLINKERTWTSQDVCSKIKRTLHLDKVGHTGTLDPFADGLLVLTINKGTKIGQFIEALDKTYIAKIKLGIATDTLDKDGEIIEERSIPNITKEDIKNILVGFLGKQKQIPPKYSAIKVNGKKLYEYARENIEVEIKERDIEIFELEMLDFDGVNITILARVSKGTYIRTLGSDIAKKLNTVGYLVELTRIRVGRYDLNNAKKIIDVTQSDIISFSDALSFLRKVKMNELWTTRVKNGYKLYLDVEEDIVCVYGFDDEPIAIYTRMEGNMFKCARGIF